MSRIICESGLHFGAFEESDLFDIENSELYKSLGKGVRSVEFVLHKNNSEVLFIEAKPSFPKPGNHVDFDEFIDVVFEKFTHALIIFFSVVLKKLDDKKLEVPLCFKEMDYRKAKVKLLLVINGHEVSWLEAINAALNIRLERQIKIWKLELRVMGGSGLKALNNLNLAVMNHELAEEYGLLYDIACGGIKK